MRPVYLLNVNAKIISKALSKHLKNVLPSLISDIQFAYVNGRFISEGGHLILDVLEISDVPNINGILVTADIQNFNLEFSLRFSLGVLKGVSVGVCGMECIYLKRL